MKATYLPTQYQLFLEKNIDEYSIKKEELQSEEWKDGEPEPEFDELNLLIEKLFPDITFIQYKILWGYTQLQRRVEDCGDRHSWGTSTYNYRKISLTDIWNFLAERVGYNLILDRS